MFVFADPIESDPVDLTSVSEIPEDEELAETFYSQVDEFEEDSNSSESDFEDEDDEYNAFVQCLGDALDMTGTQSATNSELNSSQDDRGITPSMRNHKIESLRQ